MTRTSQNPDAARPTRWERAAVLGGLALAAVWTGVCAVAGIGLETAGAVWLAALGWAVLASLALALRRGFRDRDWSAFRRCEMTDHTELADWSTQTGEYAWMAVAEEHERLMRGD